eukprot:a680227_7.p1 GENE.a680227_7~~a680227_7.p1  ORF type:complete len:542 (-),score=237.75 a680227_7:145-1728(-)
MADSLLGDLEGLDDLSDEDEFEATPQTSVAFVGSGGLRSVPLLSKLPPSVPENAKKHVDAAGGARSVWDVAPLTRSPEYMDLMARLEAALSAESTLVADTRAEIAHGTRVEHTPSYKLVLEANAATTRVHEEMDAVHRFLRDSYATRFPELETLVLGAVEYAAVVRIIGNAAEISSAALQPVLSPATAMVVSIAASHAGPPLSERDLAAVLEASALMERLAADLLLVERYIQSQMQLIAPNLSALVGTELAARLVSLAGGLTELSKLPSSTLLVIGKDARALQGLSLAAASPHEGIVYKSDIVAMVPSALRRKAARLVSAKATLCARCDAQHERTDGSLGADYRAKVLAALDHIQEPQQGRITKALPVPIDKPSKRRGGRRARKEKEKFGITELHKAANRMKFGAEEDEGIAEGAVRRLVSTKNQATAGASRAEQAKLQKRLSKARGAAGTATLGLSSVAWTPVQGIELANPAAAAEAAAKATGDFGADSKYFGPDATFAGLKRPAERDADGFALPTLLKRPRGLES